MKKILFVHQDLCVGGAEELRLTMLKYIDRSRYQVTLCCLGQKGLIGEEIERLGFEVIDLGRPLRIFEPYITAQLTGLIKKRKFDIVQTSLFFANFHGRIAARLAKAPRVFSEEHNIYPWKDRHPSFIFADRMLSRFTERIITCSNSVAAATSNQEGIPADKFSTIHNCIDFSKYRIEQTKEQLRADYGFNEKEILLGAVGALSQQKGYPYLLDALKVILSRNNNCRLLIVGEGPLKRGLESQVHKLGLRKNVSFLGCRRDVPQILKMLDIFVLSSIWEGFGIALLEAMYTGLPVIASNVDGVPEVVIDGQTGVLVPSRDSNALANAVCNIMQNPDMGIKMGQAARKWVADTFSPQNYIDKLEALYQK